MSAFLKASLAAAMLTVAATAAAAQTIHDPNLLIETYAATPFQSVNMAFIGDDDLLVLHKGTGEVYRVTGGTLLPPVLDVAVHFDNERGLLGIATDPDFVNHPYVYLYYTESPTGDDTNDPGDEPLGNRVYRYSWDGAALGNPELVLDLPGGPGPNHDGGVIDFGPDDRLYAVIGDLNRSGKLQNFPGGPDPDDSSVILRTDRHGNPLLDNPFYDPADPADPLGRYYAYGVRNSYGFGFDPVSGNLWQTENGPELFDEINRFSPGANSGWTPLMGPDDQDPNDPGDLVELPGSVYVDPQVSWRIPVVPTGLTFVASRRLGCDLEHDLIVVDFSCGNLYRFDLDGARQSLDLPAGLAADRVIDNPTTRCDQEMDDILLANLPVAITDVVNGPDGNLYVLGYQGTIYRIVPNPSGLGDSDGDDVHDNCDCAPADDTAFAVPEEVPRVRVSGLEPTRLGWDPQIATAGSGTGYAVVSGNVSDLTTDDGLASACRLAGPLAAPTYSDARSDPLPGQSFYYLVRAGNACDDGTYGDSGNTPDPRDALDVASLPDCAGSRLPASRRALRHAIESKTPR